MIKTILLWTLIATLLLTLAFMVAISIPFYKVINAPKIDTEHIEQEKFFLAFYKTIGIGFLIAFLGLIIPHVVAESKESFLRFKNSRQAYSKAKTAIIYLPLKLSNMKNSEAIAAIEEAHHKLHICETYRKELRKHLSWHLHKKTWVDRNYWELVAIRKVLDENIATWDKKEQCDRLKILVDAVDMVGECFDTKGSLDNIIWWNSLRLEREEFDYEEKAKLRQKRQSNIYGKIIAFAKESKDQKCKSEAIPNVENNTKK